MVYKTIQSIWKDYIFFSCYNGVRGLKNIRQMEGYFKYLNNKYDKLKSI